MKRGVKWSVAAVTVLVLLAVGARVVMSRKAAAPATAAATRLPGGLDLAAGDIVVAQTIELPRTLEVSGGLKAVNSAVVRAKVAAEIKSLTVREGDSVRAGQVVGQLDTVELDLRLRQAEQTASSAKSQLDIALRALDNNRALVAQGFISATGLETSISNEAGARASYEAARSAALLAKKGRSDATLVAPISGLVSQRMVQPGERVSVDAKLLEIVDLGQLELEAALAPDDVAGLAIGRRAVLRVDGLSTPVGARVARINPSAQAGTRSILAYLAVEPQPALRQGLFVRGSIELDRQRALALPLSAVRTDQSRPYVLIVKDGLAVASPVKLGARGSVGGDAWVEIASGVSEGASVLAASTGIVRDGTPVRLPAKALQPAASGSAASSAPSSASAAR